MACTADLLAQRQGRWLEFYRRQPTAGGAGRRFVFLIRYAPDLPTRPWPNPEQRAERLDWIWRNYEYHLARMEWLDDDSLPCLDMMTGTELFAEAFGCQVHRPADNNPFALPLIHSADEVAHLKIPTLDAPPLRLALEMAEELQRRAGSQALFRLVDIQSPMDIAALIWDKQSFYPALLETPEAVLELASKVKALLFAFLDEWFRRFGRQAVAHYPEYYLPQGVSVSEDEIGAVSTALFRQYFLPELVALSNHFGGLGIHCCANARHQWQALSEVPNLLLLNLNQPEPVIRQAYATFAGQVPQWHYGWDPGSAPAGWAAQLPLQARVVIDVTAETRNQALAFSDTLRQLAG